MTSMRTDAPADPNNPRARAMCDRCSQIVFHDQLIKQMEFRGNRLCPTGSKVCSRCVDKPQPQDRTVILREDPVPVRDPRPEM